MGPVRGPFRTAQMSETAPGHLNIGGDGACASLSLREATSKPYPDDTKAGTVAEQFDNKASVKLLQSGHIIFLATN